MDYTRPRHFLLKNMLPKKHPPVGAGGRGYELLAAQAPILVTLLATSTKDGLVTDEQADEVMKNLQDVVAFFKDLRSREVRVFSESVRLSSDSTLKVHLDRSFEEFAQYLDTLREILFRLRNHGIITDERYQWAQEYFETLRELHREALFYL